MSNVLTADVCAGRFGMSMPARLECGVIAAVMTEKRRLEGVERALVLPCPSSLFELRGDRRINADSFKPLKWLLAEGHNFRVFPFFSLFF